MSLMAEIINEPLMIESGYLRAEIARLNEGAINNNIYMVKPTQVGATEGGNNFLNDKLAQMYKACAMPGILEASGEEMAYYSSNTKNSDKPYKNIKNIAIIPIRGILTNRSTLWTWFYGAYTYGMIRKSFRAALSDKKIDNIILEFDTNGGTIAGLFDLADEIYAARSQKKIIAVINEKAYSAGYLIASAAEEIYANRTGGAGSIGVRAIHADTSKMEERIGVKYTEIFAGAKKGDLSPHKPLSERGANTLQDIVNDIQEISVTTVAKHRGLDVKKIIAMEAGIYQGKRALEANLIDDIKTMEEVITSMGGTSRMNKNLTDLISGAIKDAAPGDIAESMSELGYVKGEGMMSQPDHLEALKKQAIDLNAERDKQQAAAIIEAKKEGKKEALEMAIEIAELCALGGKENLTMQLLKKNVTIKEAKESILAAKVDGRNIKTNLDPMIFGQKESSEENALAADATKRAEEAKR